ncbi:hypothetical protein [Duganella callida]|uniref:Porin n=1 Tax=Duganella callida TaxID=2561932 RepID=A0A4Y9SXY3_9BURK|nr:hypothetical protein [Duganella callida]TFW30074.1 hypothetical protein E4L98_02685 [Duganella callida]
MTAVFLPKRAAVATLMMLSCCVARAGEPADDAGATPRWSVGGFGTLGVVHSSDDQSDFTANPLTPGNAGHGRDWSHSVDSRAGVQLGLDLDSKWSAVLQLVYESTLRYGYHPVVEWANVQYKLTPDLSLRVGRIALPLFLVGDYRKAGYALPWVRPPVELYGAIPITNSDGVDATYRWQSGDLHHVTQAFYGYADLPLTPTARAQARGIIGLSNTTTSGALTVRASVMASDLSVGLGRELFDGLRQFGAQGRALAQRYQLEDKRAQVGTLGLSYDPGAWFAMGEISRFNSHSSLGDTTSAYVSAGYRYRDFTPYVALSHAHANMATRVDGLDLSGLPAPMAAAGAQLNAGLNQMLMEIPRQRTVGAGVRWDFYANHALKLQVERVTPQQGSAGTFINVQPGFRSGRPITVLSAALDFVF